MTLNIILTADKIPHEVPKIHMPHLISHKKAKVLTKSRLYQYFCLTAFIFVLDSSALYIPPFLISLRMQWVHTTPHPWEDCLKPVIIIRYYTLVGNNIFTINLGIYRFSF